MSGAFVADASVAVAWVHPAQATEATQAMLESVREGAVAHVPALWFAEVANALLDRKPFVKLRSVALFRPSVQR